MKQPNNKLVVIRGAGDIATGIAVRLFNCGYQVVMTEISQPTMIRCSVSFAQCLFDNSIEVEGITATKAADKTQLVAILDKQQIPVIIDADLAIVNQLNPTYLVDAILAKTNLGMHKQLAPITIALGPGFTAGIDCDAVIETCRGHYLGRVIYTGQTLDNTGIPGNIAGYTHQRVIRTPCAGTVQAGVQIGDIVNHGDIIAYVDETPVYAPLAGMVRGMINNGLNLAQGFKMADIDPRGLAADYTTVSDKARAISGSVLEAMLHLSLKREA